MLILWLTAAVVGALAGLATLAAHAGPAIPTAPAGPHGRARSWHRAVAQLDAEVTARWRTAGVEPAAPASDAEFLRRVTLDLIGRIPTAGEAQAFLGDRSPSPRRRERLVDRLLASADYAEYWADVYLDLLVGRDLRLRPRLSADARDYLRGAFAANTPYDRLVGQILTAAGPLDGNGAAAFLVAQERKGGSIEAVAGETARIFLGLQVQCARCHDHPYDERYKKKTFADFTAFFGDVRLRRDRQAMGRPGFLVQDRPLPPRIAQRPRFQERLKKQPDLAYAFVEPRYFFRPVEPREGETRRQRLARAILSSDLCAKAAVNRIWAQLLGRSITGGAWDDLGAERDPRHPALLRLLADDFAASGYDHRRLLKVIALSSAYGRSSAAPAATEAAAIESAATDAAAAASTTRPPPAAARSQPARKAAAAAEQAFARAAVRPLSADQLYRSLLVAAGLPHDAGSAASGDAAGLLDERRRMLGLREFLFTFPDDEERQDDAFTGSVSQALLLMNGALANLGARAQPRLALGRILARTEDPGLRLEWMFLAALARSPTAAERARYLAFLGDHSPASGARPSAPAARQAYEDLYHALLTSTEFTTNH